jgi:drug/metabolite transporter (DMT)-like permease
MSTVHDTRNGIFLVAGSALAWSIGGAISRFLSVEDSWTVVFWRSTFAALFLLFFMLWRDGLSGTLKLFKNMGWPGWAVALCFAIASSSFVLALAHTTVANILLMQAGVPLIAALLSWFFFREKTSLGIWLAIGMVIIGVAIMVSESFSGKIPPIGDSLSLLIAVVFSIATVITRRHSNVRMSPAVCLATTIAAIVAGTMASGLTVSLPDLGLLVVFGAVNLGLGLALFVTGARLIPAALAALIGTIEPVLGPIWVWLIHQEIPSSRTLLGGTVILAALLIHLMNDWRRQSRERTG